MIFYKTRSKGYFLLLFCKVSPGKFSDLVLYQKDHFLAENITVDEYAVN